LKAQFSNRLFPRDRRKRILTHDAEPLRQATLSDSVKPTPSHTWSPRSALDGTAEAARAVHPRTAQVEDGHGNWAKLAARFLVHVDPGAASVHVVCTAMKLIFLCKRARDASIAST
jgi:hypothetical protein